jgi:hypothetical protein
VPRPSFNRRFRIPCRLPGLRKIAIRKTLSAFGRGHSSSCGAGTATAFLIIIAFLGALTHVKVELVVAILLIIALSLFVAALVWFGRETGISVSSADFQ